MGIKFACHECGKPLNIKTQLAGKRGKCPACGLRFRIPQSDQPFSIPLDDQSLQAGDIDEDSNDGSAATGTASSEATEIDFSIAKGGKSKAGSVEIGTKEAYREQNVPAGTRQSPAVEEDFDPLAASDAQWYVRPPNGGRYGPASGETVRQWIQEGRVTKTTLIWRDGWTQWRDCEEIIPEAFGADTRQQSSSLPPRVETEVTSPVFDLKNMHNAIAGTPPTHVGESLKSDVYLGAKKRRRSRQRVTLVSILAGVAVILVIALAVALAWPP